ncbi:oleosin H1-like [Apium graveolens]|uniref:oleosin H1-like n=1 Tax=Apium graveolens TaxID=4045 RepID=UPI003D7962CC
MNLKSRMADHQTYPHQVQVCPQHTNHSAEVISLPLKNTPSTSQVLVIVTLLPISETLLFLTGITLIGTLIGLAVATPLFFIFSPVLVPSTLTIGLAVTGFLGSGAFWLTGLSSLSWVLSYFKQTSQAMPYHIELAKKRAQEMDAYAGQKTKEVGHTIQTKAGQAHDTTNTNGRDTPMAYRKSGWLSP